MAIFLNFFPLRNWRDRSRVTSSRLPYLQSLSFRMFLTFFSTRANIFLNNNSQERGEVLLAFSCSLTGTFSFSLSTSFQKIHVVIEKTVFNKTFFKKRIFAKRWNTIILINIVVLLIAKFKCYNNITHKK